MVVKWRFYCVKLRFDYFRQWHFKFNWEHHLFCWNLFDFHFLDCFLLDLFNLFHFEHFEFNLYQSFHSQAYYLVKIQEQKPWEYILLKYRWSNYSSHWSKYQVWHKLNIQNNHRWYWNFANLNSLAPHTIAVDIQIDL